MRKSKGFTLIELMVVILIVAILAAVLAPMMSGRISQAKWTEGRTGAGTIATALRAYIAENDAVPATSLSGTFTSIGILDTDLQGKYFNVTSYQVTSITYDPTTGVTYTIKVNGPTGLTPKAIQLDQSGNFNDLTTAWTGTP